MVWTVSFSFELSLDSDLHLFGLLIQTPLISDLNLSWTWNILWGGGKTLKSWKHSKRMVFSILSEDSSIPKLLMAAYTHPHTHARLQGFYGRGVLRWGNGVRSGAFSHPLKHENPLSSAGHIYRAQPYWFPLGLQHPAVVQRSAVSGHMHMHTLTHTQYRTETFHCHSKTESRREKAC